MQGPTTYIMDPEDHSGETKKTFNFDHSYWSFDGCKEEPDGFFGPDLHHPNGHKFCDQRKVFDDLGCGVLNNAWEGYNSTLFAYGQTGSGKSWSVVGYGSNKGIVPQFCEEIFNGIDAKKALGEKVEYEVTFSMLEIYNEQVRDLLNPKQSKGGLKIRQHPKKGFFVESLKIVPVGSYKEIESRIEEGTTNRTVAATNMNATSSRAHTIVGIIFTQKFKNEAGEERAKTAVCNLVDLAGSERAESTGATGDRLKEGAAINQSLSSLGNCIAALAARSSGKNVKVPFRDSVLTKLLKNALGGNSKTIMIAAVSPADINYDESLSTLRYELIQLKKELAEEYEAQLKENDKQVEDMKKSFEEKLKAAQGTGEVSAIQAMQEKKKSVAHLFNLNFDPMLTGKINYFIEKSSHRVTNKRDQLDGDIVLMGPNIHENHAVISCENDSYSIEPKSEGARIVVNGENISETTELHHFDRLMFGPSQLYVFVHPAERDSLAEPMKEPTFEKAQKEIAKSAGFDMNKKNKSTEELLLQEDLMDTLPAVTEANAISEELDRKMKFEIVIVPAEARGELRGRPEVYVEATNLETDRHWLWPKTKFLNRKFMMTEMYNNYLDGDDWQVAPERDPFLEDDEADIHIGSVRVWLQALTYLIEVREQLSIIDYKAKDVGMLNVEALPCDSNGDEFSENDNVFVDDSEELIGKQLYYNLRLLNARGLPKQYTELYMKYRLGTEKFNSSKKVSDTTNPEWNETKFYEFKCVTKELLHELSEEGLIVQIWGKYKPSCYKKNVNTKEDLYNPAGTKASIVAANNDYKQIDPEIEKIQTEMQILQQRERKMAQQLAWFRKMLEVANDHKKRKIGVNLIQGLMDAKDDPTADRYFRLIAAEPDSDDEDCDGQNGRPQSVQTSRSSKSSVDNSCVCIIL
ncbi:kinesin-like protein KIF28 isoform X3 [Tubulanus polymorphus]|uniref:kinesin-like protein KIF28 isoform X3 n=1 Tax=Tubulanus polymorphus TaxID=672921 RepID=UPI003DA5E477